MYYPVNYVEIDQTRDVCFLGWRNEAASEKFEGQQSNRNVTSGCLMFGVVVMGVTAMCSVESAVNHLRGRCRNDLSSRSKVRRSRLESELLCCKECDTECIGKKEPLWICTVSLQWDEKHLLAPLMQKTSTIPIYGFELIFSVKSIDLLRCLASTFNSPLPFAIHSPIVLGGVYLLYLHSV